MGKEAGLLKRGIVPASGFLLILLACAGGIEMGFEEPKQENTMLVVGRVLLEIGTTLNAGLYDGEMSVAVVGQTENGKTVGYWTKADAEGYYAFSNVPKGRYMIKTIKAMVRDLGIVTITSRLTGGNNFYFLSKNEIVAFSGNYFPNEPSGRVIDLNHMIVHLEDPDMVRIAVQSNFYSRLSGYKTVTGEILDEGTVPQVFIRKYPDSAWKKELEKAL
jgi:hypothetical protein